MEIRANEKESGKPKPIQVREWDALSAVLPPLAFEEYAVLKDSIKKEGVKYPVLILPNGQIIDGVNRLRIAGKGCPMRVLDISERDAFKLGLTLNLGRRISHQNERGKYCKRLRRNCASENLRRKRYRKFLASRIRPSAIGKEKEVIPDPELFLPSMIFGCLFPRQRTRTSTDKLRKKATIGEVAADYGVSPKRVGQIVGSGRGA